MEKWRVAKLGNVNRKFYHFLLDSGSSGVPVNSLRKEAICIWVLLWCLFLFGQGQLQCPPLDLSVTAENVINLTIDYP